MELIRRCESIKYPGLFVKKYTKKVFWNNLWHLDDNLLEARGHVELADGTVVVKPFSKIFNYGENETTIDPHEECLYIRKINGFMATVTYVPFVNDVVVSTTGSLDSDYVAIAESHLADAKDYVKYLYNCTGIVESFMFEICDFTDVHIVPETFGAYLIGGRAVSNDKPYFSDGLNELTLDSLAKHMNVYRPEWAFDTFENVVDMAKKCNHEGFVIYGMESKTALKIKSPYYLTLKAMARKADILSLDKSRIDEEYYPLFTHLKTPEVAEKFNALNEQDRLRYITDFLYERNVIPFIIEYKD